MSSNSTETRSDSSAASSSSSTSTTRPSHNPFPGLFPPLGPNTHGAMSGVPTSHSDSSHPLSSSSSPSSASASSPHTPLHASYATPAEPIPERCFTFCTSRQDAQSMCRMFCLRNKAVQATREEELARLRPRGRENTREMEQGQETLSGTLSSAWSSFSPLESLRKTLAPYSFVYIKGTATGVVGRYMEELEGDDGHRDFGPESRHAEEKRGKEREIAWYSWGEEGALLYVPLTSIFHPILSIPSTLSFFLSPPLRFLSAYRDSFTDGTQLRNARSLYEASTDGSAYNMADKLITHHRAKVAALMQKRKEALEEREAQRADMQAQLDEQKKQRWAETVRQQSRHEHDTAAGSRQPQASPTGARSGGLRDRLEEAMERERARKADDRDTDERE